MFFVGDIKQSIYRFRGATIENILNFENQFDYAKVIRLEQNYRSTQNILDAANAIIKNNRARKGKNLWTDFGEGEKINNIVTFAETNKNEADEFMLNSDIGAANEGQIAELVWLINNHMEDYEKDVYNYYIGKGDVEKANEYGGSDNISVIVIEPFTNEVKKC